MIQLRQVSKVFNRGEVNEVTALHPLDLDIQSGEFVVLVGTNGSGKSTLLNLIAGSVFPSSGRILFQGQDVTYLPEHKRTRWLARVFQNPLGGTAPELSVIDNFRLAALRTRRKGLKIGVSADFRSTVAGEVSKLGLGLEGQLQQPMGTLSGGQRQALTLLMAGMDHMEVLLLDEPTAALDPRSAILVMETARRLIAEHGLTAILITHHLEQALQFGNRLLFLSGGRLQHDLDAHEKSGLSLQDLQSWFD
jgi:putative ABC transport system ATP-binding protein